MATRPYWSGQIRLSLVTLEVNMFAALSRSRQIPLHEIYRPTGERVHHQNIAGDKAVSRDDIVKGYEVEKGEYVILEPEEIAALKVPSKKTLEIVQFVDTYAIDEIYYETPYFVVPASDSAMEGYNVIRDALRETKKAGVGQLAINGRERLCTLKPCGSGILLETLRYKEEIRQSDAYFEDIKKTTIDKEQLSLAKELIKRKTSGFNPAKFHDHYTDALKELIDSKIEHRPIHEEQEEKPAGKVINLMDALRKSLNEKSSGAPAKTKKPAPKKSAAKNKSPA